MTCSLNYAADMLQLMSDGLLKSPRIEPVLGTVSKAVRDPRVSFPLSLPLTTLPLAPKTY
jgi:hypothetical protein